MITMEMTGQPSSKYPGKRTAKEFNNQEKERFQKSGKSLKVKVIEMIPIVSNDNMKELAFILLAGTSRR